MESVIHWLLGLKGEAISPGADWTVRFFSAPPLWVVLLLVVPLIAGFVFVIYRREGPSAPPFSRGAMAALRFLAIFLVLLMLFDPVVSVERTLSRRSYVAVLVDDSLSMELGDHYASEKTKRKMARVSGIIDSDRFLIPEENERFEETNRMEFLKRTLARRKEKIFGALARDHRVKIYAFSSSVKRDVDVDTLRPEGRMTKIGDALWEAAADLKGQPVSAFLLFSDGCENAGTPAVEVAGELGKRDPPVPVHTVGVGSPEAPKDLQVLDPEAEETILVGDEWEVEVTVRQHGFDSIRSVDLRLVGDDAIAGGVVKTKPILIGEKQGDQREKIVHRPRKPGRYTFRVEVPVQEGEVISDNNAVTVHLTVVDDKIRVLYVDHYPRYEYRYLKTALIRDTHMRANILLIAADPTFPQERSPEVEPLQVFPETEKDLYAFDVIVLGDVNPEAEASRSIFLDPERQMKWMARFVRLLGGGMVFIAGENNNPVALKGTPLEPLLPVVPPAAQSLPSGPFVESFLPRRTPLGRDHPILSLDSDPARNEKLWGDPDYALPGFYWYVEIDEIKPGAQVLARHPFHPPNAPDHKKDPVFVFQHYGAGKTFFSATDATWRWRYRYGDRWFYRFWRNVIRFVGQQRLLGEKKRFVLGVDKTEYILGEPARVSAKVLNENYQPSSRPFQEVVVEKPDGTLDKIRLQPKPAEEGVFEDTLNLDQLGPYTLAIEEEMPTGEVRRMTTVSFSVQVPKREYENPLMDRVTLRQIAEASGGRFYFLHEIDKMIEELPETVRKREQPLPGMPLVHRLWDSWLSFALLLAVLTAEWLYRKIYRLL